MASFENDVVVAKNLNFDQVAAKPHLGIINAAGKIPIGTGNLYPTPEILGGSLTSPDNSITFSYSSPNITAIVAGGSTVGKTITGNTGGALNPTLGNWNILTANTTVKFAGSVSTLTQDFGLSNLLIGSPGSSITSGTGNVSLGTGSLGTITSGSNNVALGISLNSLLTGSGNIVIGSAALVGGGNYTTSESNNIAIGNSGTGGESNTIRIGSQGGGVGQQNRTFVAGVTGVTAAGAPAAISSTGQLSDLGFGTSTQVLTSNGAGVSPTWQATAAGVITTTYNVADSPATWTKNANTKFVTVYVWGGGGGGGSGRKGASTAAGGGGGGGAGDVAFFQGPASVFNNSESITIGAGGTGGALQSVDAQNGNAGNPGNASSFGNISARGGNGGTGGTTTTAAGGGIRQVLSNLNAANTGSAGATGRQTAGDNSTGIVGTGFGLLAATSGGGGGGADTVTERAGGTGGPITNAVAATILAGGAGGLESTGINGSVGNPPLTTGGVIAGGSGGGGGGGYSVGAGGATTGGTGGNGALRGAGGGGGGGGISTVSNSGAGGNGGDGQVIVIEFL